MKRLLFISVSALLLCSSCVSKKKYLLAENGRLEAIGRGDALKEELIKCKDDNDALNNRIAALIRDTTTMGRDIRNYQTMLNTNMGEQDKLNALLQQKMSELDERERTINELQDMMNAQNEKVQNLLSSVKDALLGFNSDELTVTEKNGKVYVAIEEDAEAEHSTAAPAAEDQAERSASEPVDQAELSVVVPEAEVETTAAAPVVVVTFFLICPHSPAFLPCSLFLTVVAFSGRSA